MFHDKDEWVDDPGMYWEFIVNRLMSLHQKNSMLPWKCELNLEAANERAIVWGPRASYNPTKNLWD